MNRGPEGKLFCSRLLDYEPARDMLMEESISDVDDILKLHAGLIEEKENEYDTMIIRTKRDHSKVHLGAALNYLESALVFEIDSDGGSREYSSQFLENYIQKYLFHLANALSKPPNRKGFSFDIIGDKVYHQVSSKS